jgi:hypothetical protein
MTVLQNENFEDQQIGQPIDPALTVFTDQLGTITCVTGLAGTGKAANLNPSNTGQFRSAGWTPGVKMLARAVIRVSAQPSADMVIMHAYDGVVATGIRIGDVMWQADGKLRMRSGFSTVATTTLALSTNTDYAVEWLVDLGTRTQTLRVYTDLDQQAQPVAEITGATPSTPSMVTQFQIGKMTTGTWTGGITVDEWIRADDWYAVATADTYNEHFDSLAIGASVAVNANINSITGTPPVIAAGGVRTDQKAMSYPAGSSAGPGEVESKRFPSGVTLGYHRFYCKISEVPADPTENMVFWQAKGIGGGASFGLSATGSPSVGNTVDVLLWSGTDWTGYADGSKSPQGQVNIPVGTWFRVEIKVTDDGNGHFTCQADFYVGTAKHLSGSTNRAARLTGLAVSGGIRAAWLGQTLATPGVNKVPVQFDEWRGTTAGPVGAIPLSEQSDTPVGQQWAFTEWDGPQGPQAETPLILEGVIQGDDNADTFRVRKGQFQKNGRDFVPVGFNMMAAALPDGSEDPLDPVPAETARATWEAHSTEFMTAMRDDWHVDTFRLQLGQAGIDPQGINYSQTYVDRVVDIVSTLRDNGFITILCMQDWDGVHGEMHELPTAHTNRAWAKLLPYINAWSSAKRSGVAAEIFNEPWIASTSDPITPSANDWSQWKNGGHPSGTISQATNQGDLAVGHQQVLEAIRATGFKGVVLASGPDKGHTLSGITPLTDTLANPNVAYTIHTQHYHVNGNTADQDRVAVWEPRWSTPRALNTIAVTATEWSMRREVADGDTNNLKPATEGYLQWHHDQGIGMQPWAIDTDPTDNYAYVMAVGGANAWVPNDWDLWTPPPGTPNNTGSGELLFALYPTWGGQPTVEPIELGSTEISSETTTGGGGGGEAFTGDPGMGQKMYVGVDTYASSDRWNLSSDFMVSLRSLSAGTNWPTNSRVTQGGYRGFYASFNPSISWGKHTDASWPLHRKVAANVAMASWTFDSLSASGAAAIFGGDRDGFLDTLAIYIQEFYERYGHLFILDLGNEPDAWGNAANQSRVPLWHHNLRRAMRYVHFYLLDKGVDERAFMVSSCTLTQGACAQHVVRHGKPINTSGLNWNSTFPDDEQYRGDALYYYCSDWKETRTATGGYWTDAFDPNPADFIQPGEMDEWNYGRGPIMKMWSCNIYERPIYEDHGGYDSETQFRGTKSSNTFSTYPGYLFKFNQALYGGSSPVLPLPHANNKGLPISVGEWSMGVMVLEPTDPTDPAVTADVWTEVHLPDLLANNVVMINKWRYVQPAYGGSSIQNDAMTFHWKCGTGGRGSKLYDDNNANSKAYAALFNTDMVADPPPWPDGTKRAPNSGAVGDYRGFADVPT